MIPRILRRQARRLRGAARGLRVRMHNRPTELRPGGKWYQRRQEEELKHYASVFYRQDAEGERSRETLVEPAPPSWVEILRRNGERIREATGHDLVGHVVSRLKARGSARLLSLGSGPGGVELVFAREAPEAEYVCLDLNPDLLKLGAGSAAAEGLPVRFEPADLNTVVLPERAFDLVFCHASLHHVIELERLLEQVRRTLRPGGELIVMDVIARPGYRMWPKTRATVRSIWRTLPARYRLNHTAYEEKRVDRRIWEGDTRRFGMECIRGAEIVPLLEKHLVRRWYVPSLAFCRRFFDTMYGPNYDLERPLDLAILNWLWALDCELLSSGQLRPESFFGVYGVEA